MDIRLITRVINDLAPDAQWVMRGDTLESLQWIKIGGQVPTIAEITEEVARRQAELDATEYQRLRAPEYPPLSELADAIYWQSQGDESKMVAYLEKVAAVKEKYPKV